jgi:hypothetical protein
MGVTCNTARKTSPAEGLKVVEGQTADETAAGAVLLRRRSLGTGIR